METIETHLKASYTVLIAKICLKKIKLTESAKN